MVFDKKRNILIEEQTENEKSLLFLYDTTLGRIFLKIITKPFFSKLIGLYYKSIFSAKKILPFITKYKIDIGVSNICDFRTFNDFFIRKRKINIESDLIAIAESKLFVYPITSDLQLKIKKSIYSIEDLVSSKEIASAYKGGYCLVFRLGLDDYHRFLYLDDGVTVSTKFIKGELHTVRPISEKFNVFTRNSRVVNILQTKHLGLVTQIEVGALLVGCIQNHNKSSFVRGDEKGYFEYGGSTIVVLLPKDSIKIDECILDKNSQDYEVKVCIGERIGKFVG